MLLKYINNITVIDFMIRAALWSQTDTVLSSLADKIYSEFIASLITAPLCGRYCLIGFSPDLESKTNTVLIYEPVAKRACSGQDDTHSNAPDTPLQIKEKKLFVL